MAKEQLLQDPELVTKLDEISEVDSSSAYASRQSSIEFCKMMWRLAEQEGTNPHKEMKLLEELLDDKDVEDIFDKSRKKNFTRADMFSLKTLNALSMISVIDLGCGNGQKALLLTNKLPFHQVRYFPIDISPYMGEITLHNLTANSTKEVIVVDAYGKNDSDKDPKQTVFDLLDNIDRIQQTCSEICESENLRDFLDQYDAQGYDLIEAHCWDRHPDCIIHPDTGEEVPFRLSLGFLRYLKSIPTFALPKKEDIDKMETIERDSYVESIAPPMIDYFVKYFEELQKKLSMRDFESIIEENPYKNSEFATTLIPSLWYVPFVNFRTYTGEVWLRYMKGLVQTWPLVIDTYLPGCEELGEVIDQSIGRTRLDTIVSKSFNKCLIPPKGFNIDFFDFQTIYDNISYVTSFAPGGKKLFLLLGQTLGNYSREERELLLSSIYKGLRKDDFFLVGVDLCPETNLSLEARQFRIKRIKAEYQEGESFARSCMRTDQSGLQYIVDFDETTNDVVIDFEDSSGTRKPFFRSHKFSYQEVTDLLTNSGFKIVGAKTYIPQTSIDYGKEYTVILCKKVEE